MWFTNKNSLDLSFNNIKILPDSFHKIQIGCDLDLSNNDLIELPHNFDNIKLVII